MSTLGHLQKQDTALNGPLVRGTALAFFAAAGLSNVSSLPAAAQIERLAAVAEGHQCFHRPVEKSKESGAVGQCERAAPGRGCERGGRRSGGRRRTTALYLGFLREGDWQGARTLRIFRDILRHDSEALLTVLFIS